MRAHKGYRSSCNLRRVLSKYHLFDVAMQLVELQQLVVAVQQKQKPRQASLLHSDEIGSCQQLFDLNSNSPRRE
jgi:hypothetical protein